MKGREREREREREKSKTIRIHNKQLLLSIYSTKKSGME